MSINWVMLSDSEGFVLLPGEQRLYTSPKRISLTLQSSNKFPGRQPFSLSAGNGQVYLTNRRIIYLPKDRTPDFQSFAAPLLNLHDTHVQAPWFGANAWVAAVQPVLNGGIPPHHSLIELKMSFGEGGAYDFHTSFERIKERFQQLVQVARENGQAGGDGPERTAAAGINIDAVHLDELPAYEATAAPASTVPQLHASGIPQDQASAPTPPLSAAPTPSQPPVTSPAEPPPGYEEAQRDSVTEELERNLRTQTERGEQSLI